MMLSELINKLEKVYAEHGNVRVLMRNMDWNTLCDIEIKLKGDDYGHLQTIVEPAK